MTQLMWPPQGLHNIRRLDKNKWLSPSQGSIAIASLNPPEVEELGNGDVVEFNGQIPLKDISTYDLTLDTLPLTNRSQIRFSKGLLDGEFLYIHNQIDNLLEIYDPLTPYALAGAIIKAGETFTTTIFEFDFDWSFDGLFFYVTQLDTTIKLFQYHVDTGAGGLPYRFNEDLILDGNFDPGLAGAPFLKIDVADDGFNWYSIGKLTATDPLSTLIQYSNPTKDQLIGSSVVSQVTLPSILGSVRGFKIVGNHFIAIESSSDKIFSYPMSVKGDINTIDFGAVTQIDIDLIEGDSSGLETNQTGTEIFLNGSVQNKLQKFEAPTVQELVEVIE